MKHIVKKKEPISLTNLRNTEGSSYTGPQSDWQKQLLLEQGHLCAYCMGRISQNRKNGKPLMEVEHYESREQFPEKGLIWKNMLGVCNGNNGLKPHCDKTGKSIDSFGKSIKGKADGSVSLNILNPLSQNSSEKIISYSISGKIIPNTQNDALLKKIEEDLDCILNLNDEKLVQFRRDTMDRAKDKLIKNIPTRKWNKKDIEKEIEEWKVSKNEKLQPYCQAAIWFLESLMKKAVYQ